MLKYPEKLEAL